jgi:hypothetical protein
MRNSTYKDDIKVFSFINSDECDTYDKFTKFLLGNALPLRERWVFYFFGKTKWLDSNAIGQMETQSFVEYGGFVSGEIYYWQKYLSDESEDKQRIESDLKENGISITPELINKTWIEAGWNYVDDQINAGIEEENNRVEDYSYNKLTRESSYCGTCQESPCMCSDREKSSMTHEF